MARKPEAPKPRNPFRVIEVGAGKVPRGLLEKARRSIQRGQAHREFIGVDSNGINVNKLLGNSLPRRTANNLFGKPKLMDLPANLRFVEKCAVEALENLPAESQHIIFGSFLLNNVGHSSKCWPGADVECKRRFMEHARMALKPGGRLVLVQDKANVPFYKEGAQAYGFFCHAIEIPDAVAAKSLAESIRSRATKRGRMQHLKGYMQSGVTKQEIQAKISIGEIKSKDDYTRPVALIMRKPRKGEKGPEAPIAPSITIPLEALPPEIRLVLMAKILENQFR